MADDKSTEPDAPAEPVAEETSTKAEAPETDDGKSLEDMDISFDDFPDDETDETVEPTEDEASATSDEEESTDQPAEDAEESDDKEVPDESNDTDEPVVDEKEQARQAYEQRQRDKAEREAKEQAKRDLQQEYLDAAEDDKDLALRQLQVDAYNNRIESNSNKLQSTLERAVNSIPEFRDGTPAVKARLVKAVDTFEELYVTKDRNGDPTQVKGDLYEYLQSEVSDIRELLGDGARAQTNSKNAQKSRTVTPPVKAPKEAKKTEVDEMLSAFDEEANRWN